MASGWTDKGMAHILGQVYRGDTAPTNYYLALVDQTTTPIISINTKGELTEVPAGNGYTTGGVILTANATDFDVLTEAATTLLQIKDIVWTAAGGNLPASGAGARWAILTDDNVTQGSREVYAWFDLVSNRIISDTQTLTLQNCEINLS